MPTNRIGSGTCNLSFNAPKGWRSYLGRMAFAHDLSMGEAIRRLIARGVHIWACARWAAKAEQADLEAIAVLRSALEDGIGPEDQPAIERALVLIQASAKADHKAAQLPEDMEEIPNV